jgi:hypothetical protein
MSPTFSGLQSVIYKMTELFITTAVGTSNPTYPIMVLQAVAKTFPDYTENPPSGTSHPQ